MNAILKFIQNYNIIIANVVFPYNSVKHMHILLVLIFLLLK